MGRKTVPRKAARRARPTKSENKKQRKAQASVELLQHLVNEHGCDPTCDIVIATARIAGLAHTVVHEEETFDDVDTLLIQMRAWMAAQKVRPPVAFLAASELANRIAISILHDRFPSSVPNHAWSEPPSQSTMVN